MQTARQQQRSPCLQSDGRCFVLAFILFVLLSLPAEAVPPPAPADFGLDELPTLPALPADVGDVGGNVPVVPRMPAGRALAPSIGEDGEALPLRSRGRSTSSSGQFVIVADELQVRATVARMCEELKRQMLSVLGMGDEWRTPMVIVVNGGRPQPGQPDFQVRMRRLQGGDFHLQMDIWVHERFRRQGFQEELLRLLLAEVILREIGRGELPQGRALLPSWLHLGISETITYRQRGFPSALFATVFRAGSQLSVEEILRTEPDDLDSVTAEVFRASACALVQTLLDQPGGTRHLQAYLKALPRSEADPWDLLTEHFPALADSGSLEKWWALQMASLATPTPFESMTAGETENRLRNILQVTVPIDPETGERQASGAENTEGRRFRVPLIGRFLPGRDKADQADEEDAGVAVEAPRARLPGVAVGEWRSIPIRDWPQQLGPQELDRLLTPVLRNLEGLAMRSHPLFQAIIQDYTTLITVYGSGTKVKDWEQRINHLENERANLIRRSREVDGYLDWYEANHSEVRSGEFDRYLEAAARLEGELPPREDAVSGYLDQLSREFR